jgi:diamine N-acetyltransferase
MELKFRLATDEDINTLLEFMRQFYLIDDYAFDKTLAQRALQGIVNDATQGRVWLIMRHDEAIGYIAITFGYSLEYHGRDAFIDELFIRADQRQQGVGTKVMQFVVEECSQLGVHALHLEVERENSVGQRLYHNFGFEDHDRHMLTKRILP